MSRSRGWMVSVSFFEGREMVMSGLAFPSAAAAGDSSVRLVERPGRFGVSAQLRGFQMSLSSSGRVLPRGARDFLKESKRLARSSSTWVTAMRRVVAPRGVRRLPVRERSRRSSFLEAWT